MRDAILQLETILDAIQPMKHSRLRNYIAPGLTSHLIGGGEFGKVRLFSAERATMEFITPHSHRFDFTCLVLKGLVHNTIFTQHPQDSIFVPSTVSCEAWCVSTINQVCGANGLMNYVHERDSGPTHWLPMTDRWCAGDTYSMTYDQIHSIKFERGSQVLFFEGPQVSTVGKMLEPWENGKVIPTFRTEPWMFDRTEDDDNETA
jgi:hypothetical protein